MRLLSRGLQEGAIYSFGLVLVRLGLFLSLPLLVRHFTPEKYAIIALFIAFRSFTRFVLQLEVSQAVAIFFSDSRNKKSRELYFSTGFWFTVVINSGIFFLVSIIYWMSNYIGFSWSGLISFPVFICSALALTFDSINYFFINIIRWKGDSKYYTLVNVISSWFAVLMIYLFYFLHMLNLTEVFLSWLVSWFVGSALGLVRVRRILSFKFCVPRLKRMLRFSFPLFLNNLPSQMNVLVDRYVVLSMFGLYFSGIYSAALSLASLTSFIPELFQLAIKPLVYKQSKKNTGKEEVVKLFQFFSLLIGCLLLLVTLFSKPAIDLVLGSYYSASQVTQLIIPLLFMSYLVRSLSVFFPGLIVSRKTYYVIISTVISFLSNIFLGFVLGYFLGVVGVSIALVISIMIQVVMTAVFSQRFYYLPFRLKQILGQTVFFVIAFLIFYGLNYSLGVEWITRIILSFLILVPLIYFFCKIRL